MNRIIENKRILVTGGAGFIGSSLVDALLSQGNEVVCLDNFSTGKRENIAPFMSNKAFTLIEGDIRNLDTCRKAVDGVNVVFHEAALGSVPRSIADPITTNDVNISGFLNMLVATRDAKIPRFVFAASSSTYGDSKELPKVEDKIGRPLSPYAITKYVNELYADVFGRTYGIETVGLRYFNVYGPKQDPNGAYAAVIPKFINLLVNGKQPIIFGDGLQSRDFTYISNVIQANQLAALAGSDAAGQVFNVACGETTTLTELTNLLITNLAKFEPSIADIKPIYGDVRVGDILHSLASIDKAKNMLGYNPTVKIAEGIKNTTDWFYKKLKA